MLNSFVTVFKINFCQHLKVLLRLECSVTPGTNISYLFTEMLYSSLFFFWFHLFKASSYSEPGQTLAKPGLTFRNFCVFGGISRNHLLSAAPLRLNSSFKHLPSKIGSSEVSYRLKVASFG